MSVIDQINKLFQRKPESQDGGNGSSALAEFNSVAMLEQANASTVSQESLADESFAQSRMIDQGDDTGEAGRDVVTLPLLGSRSGAAQRRILYVLLGIALVILVVVTFTALTQADRVAQQVAATGQSLMQSQRLAKSVSQALVGSAQAFPDVKDSSDALSRTVRGLKTGDESLTAVGPNMLDDMNKISPLIERAEKNAGTVMAQQKILTQVGSALRTINRQSSDLLEIAETVSSLKLQQNAPPAEISAAGQLVMLTQRIGKSANEFLTMEGVSPEAVFLLGKDLNSFKEIAQGLLEGSPELRLSAAKDAQTRERGDDASVDNIKAVEIEVVPTCPL